METAIEGYSVREVAEVLGLPKSKILAWTRSGLLSPRHGPAGDFLYGFQDIVLLRTARGLVDAEVPLRRIRQALQAIRKQLPAGRPLSAVRLSALGNHVMVQDEGSTWDAASGQLQLDFTESPSERPTTWPESRIADAALDRTFDTTAAARACFDRGLGLEVGDAEGAVAAYRNAVELDPSYADAHLNLGRLLHEGGDPEGALAEYAAAAESDPGCPRAHYNLGVALEDLGRADAAAAAYRTALALDDCLPAAHFNLARLSEARGLEADALQHLAAYKRLLDLGEPAD